MTKSSSQDISNNAAVLKELSDIKSSLAVNTEKTSTITTNITEIKGDIKEIKNDFVARRELNDSLSSIRKTIEDNKTSTDALLKTHSEEIESLIGTRDKTIGALIVLQIIWGLVVFLVSKFL